MMQRDPNATSPQEDKKDGIGRALGLGLITGAADDDCFGHRYLCECRRALWPRPALDRSWNAADDVHRRVSIVEARTGFGPRPLSCVKDFYPRWLLWAVLVGVLIGNTIEAAADLGGMAASINIFLPVPIPSL